MKYKFEKLQIWQLSMDLLDFIYDYVRLFPEEEKFNLKTQMIRAGTSISLNIAEGSTGNSDAEQSRFLKVFRLPSSVFRPRSSIFFPMKDEIRKFGFRYFKPW